VPPGRAIPLNCDQHLGFGRSLAPGIRLAVFSPLWSASEIFDIDLDDVLVLRTIAIPVMHHLANRMTLDAVSSAIPRLSLLKIHTSVAAALYSR